MPTESNAPTIIANLPFPFKELHGAKIAFNLGLDEIPRLPATGVIECLEVRDIPTFPDPGTFHHLRHDYGGYPVLGYIVYLSVEFNGELIGRSGVITSTFALRSRELSSIRRAPVGSDPAKYYLLETLFVSTE